MQTIQPTSYPFNPILIQSAQISVLMWWRIKGGFNVVLIYKIFFVIFQLLEFTIQNFLAISIWYHISILICLVVWILQVETRRPNHFSGTGTCPVTTVHTTLPRRNQIGQQRFGSMQGPYRRIGGWQPRDDAGAAIEGSAYSRIQWECGHQGCRGQYIFAH